MLTLKQFLFICLVLLFVALLLAYLIPFAMTNEQETSNIGNMVLDYSVTRTIGPHTRYRSAQPNINKFFENLPAVLNVSDRSKQLLDKYRILYKLRHPLRVYAKGNLQFTNLWVFTPNSEETNAYWDEVAPVLRPAIDSALRKTNVKTDVIDICIHLRCSDVPFLKHRLYHIQSARYYEWALQHINASVNEHITILASHKWRADPKNETMCEMWTRDLKTYLEHKGFVVTIQSESSLQDYATLFWSKKSIGSCSSFCFTASIGKASFVMPLLGKEDVWNGTYERPTVIPQWMYTEPGILHSSVKDYYNRDEMIVHLGFV